MSGLSRGMPADPILKKAEMNRRRVTRHREKNRKTQTPRNPQGSPVYHKYIYVQEMTSELHMLSHVSKQKKNVRHELSEAPLVKAQVSFDITDHLFYAFKGFHRLPHGSADRDGMFLHLGGVLMYGNHGRGAPCHHIRSTDIISLTHPNVRVAFPGSPFVENFQCIALDESRLLETILRYGTNPAMDGRDRNDCPNAVARRITVGYSQPQSGNSKRSRYLGNVCLPFASFDRAKKIPEDLRAQLGQVLSLAQKYLDAFYCADDPPPMYDQHRTDIFAKKFCSVWGPLCDARFEFVDLFAESGSRLNRHMDYCNDKTAGYDYGASYSYLKEKGGSTYRVNIIMCTRLVCGSAMKKIAG